LQKKITVRTEKYGELKELWEKLNEKVVLEYKFENETNFKELFTNYLLTENNKFEDGGLIEMTKKIEVADGKAILKDSVPTYRSNREKIKTMKYSDFLKELSKVLDIQIKTIHRSIIDSGTDINSFLNMKTIRTIKQNFEYYLMANAFNKFSIEYQNVSGSIHPTKLTSDEGLPLKEITASEVGLLYSEEDVAQNYYFDELYYDSDLEKSNIQSNIDQVIVFTKIPKNSIKIPVAGGKSYSPDFAYVLKFKDGEQKLHFIVETKNVGSMDELRQEEKVKIKHAERFFDGKLSIEFRTQFSGKQMKDLISEILYQN
jgi:type III restriction enzyme